MSIQTADRVRVPKNTRPLWGDRYPELGHGPVPVDYLYKQEFFDLEREKIFRNCWLYVGRTEEFPARNGFLVREVEICKASILLTRDDAGNLSAFHNICKHRLNKLTYERSGSAASFVCNYHAWAYDRKGTLRHVPDEEAFPELEKSNCNLTPVAVDQWRGFIFINLNPKPRETLMEYLEDIPKLLEEFPFEDLTGAVHSETPIGVNWKVGAQTNMESYHAERLHSASMLLETDEINNPGNRPIDLRLFKRHRMFAYGGKDGPRLTYPTPLFKNMKEFGDSRILPGSNLCGDERWGGDVWFIFPNLTLSTARGNFSTLSYWPLTRNTSRLRFHWYFQQPKSMRQVFADKCEYQRQANILVNDIWAGDRVQEGIETQAADVMQLSDSELCIRHEYHVYMAELGLT